MVNRNVFALINSKILYNTFMEYTLSTEYKSPNITSWPHKLPRKQIMYLNIDVIINLLMSTLLFIGIKAYIDDNNRNILYINPPPPFCFGKWKPYMRNILKKISVWTSSILSCKNIIN